MVFTGAEILALKNGLRKAGSAVGKAALTGPGPGAGSVEKRVRTRRVPGLERRQQTVEAADAERIARKLVERVSGQGFVLPGKTKPRRLTIPAADVDRLAAGVEVLMTALPDARADMALVLEVHGEPQALADRMREAMPEAEAVVGAAWVPVLDELVGIVCEHIVEFFTARETFGAAAGLELLKQSAHNQRPEVSELLADYTRLVREKSRRIRLFGLDLHEDDQAYDLMTGFVDLTVETADGTDGGWPDRARHTERTSWNRLDVLVHERRRILVEGPAGSGKSTLTQWLTLTCLTNPPTAYSPPRSLVPFLIRLREFVGDQALNLPQPADFLKALAPPLTGRLPGWESNLIRSSRAAVLVDGIDEIPEQFRDDALQWLQDMVTAYPNAYYMVTTRPAGLDQSWRQRLVHMHGFTRATINPMSAEQVSTFIDRWHDAAAERPHADRDALQECGASLKQAIRWRRDLSRITTTPLLCAMVCALYLADNRALPQNRTALYERACAMLLEKRDTQQKIQTFPVPLTREQIEPFLSEIALWMLVNKQRSIPQKIALELVAEVLPRLQVPDPPKSWKPTAEEMLRHLIVRSGVLQEPTMELVEFVHPSFQDFLAAKRVFQKAYLPHLIENAHDTMYQDVAVMAAGQVQNDRDRQDELLERLIERAKTDRKQSRQLYLLAAACVADAAMVDPKWVKLVRKQTRYLLPPQSTREAQVLAAAGEFTLDLLADVGRTRKFTVPEAEATVEAIGLMGGGGDVGTRILQGLAERFGLRIAPQLITAWHQTQNPQEFRDEVLAHGDFSATTVTITSTHLLEYLEGLPGLDRLALAGEDVLPLTALDLKGLAIFGTHVRSLPDYPSLAELTVDRAPNAALGGVGRFRGLTSVTIRNIPEPELDELTTLPLLSSVTITGAEHLDLAPLAEIPTLTGLALRASGVTDLTPLAEDRELEELSIDGSRVTSDEALPHVTSLTIDTFDRQAAGMFPRLTSLTTDDLPDDDEVRAGLPRLTTLSLRGEDVLDLRPLAGLPHLRSLELWTSHVDQAIGFGDLRITELKLLDDSGRSLAVLEQAPLLEALRLNHAPGAVLAKLPALPQLKELDLWGVSRPALAKLSARTGISRLSMGRAEDADLQDLATLPGLTDLELSNTHSLDMEPLKRLVGLERLLIYRVKHFDRSVLRALTGLKDLALDGDSPIDPAWLPPDAELTLLNTGGMTPAELAVLPTLRSLTLSKVPEGGLAALAVVPAIEHLELSHVAGVQTLDLADWPALRSLKLTNVPGVDFTDLAGLPNLRALDVDRMAHSGIDALPGLEILRLGRTRVGLSELIGLPRLQGLILDRRPESDLSVLARLPCLKRLELVDMPQADLKPFQARPDIELIVS